MVLEQRHTDPLQGKCWLRKKKKKPVSILVYNMLQWQCVAVILLVPPECAAHVWRRFKEPVGRVRIMQ